MSDIVKSEQHPVSAAALEHILGTGDLSKLTTPQRVEYYARTCQSLGLNPLTRPFRFLALNGQIQLYATKDCTDQLRTIHGITLHLVDKTIDGELFIVTARARNKDGREDEDIGAVMLPKTGESRANALMKGTTKAKRRVTLSICGLGGMADESELDGMPGAKTFDAEDDLPVAPIRDAREDINRDVPLKATASDVKRAPRVAETDEEERLRDREMWLNNVGMKFAAARSHAEVMLVGELKSVKAARENGPPEVQERLTEMMANAYGRFPTDKATWTPDMSDDLPEVEIEGEAKVFAG